MFRVLAFTVKPRESADTRYRILQYQAVAAEGGVQIDHRSMMGARYFRWQIENTHLIFRLMLLPFLTLQRLSQVLLLAPQYDAVWISREMYPFGPPIFEQLLIWRSKRVILDVDDALHIVDKASSRWLPRLLRDQGKFGRIAARYNMVVCGNAFLGEFYKAHGAIIAIVPTVVDVERYSECRSMPSDAVRIGWIGTPLNRHHLEFLKPAFAMLARERVFELVLVGLNQPLGWDFPGIRYPKWSLANELDFFSDFDIGIMPLQDSPFARGKCAFKLVQYMAAGLPVVASPVGANCDVIEHGRNGFLAETQEEWCGALGALIDDVKLRRQLGESGRIAVRQAYSVQGVWPRYSSILTGSHIKVHACAS